MQVTQGSVLSHLWEINRGRNCSITKTKGPLWRLYAGRLFGPILELTLLVLHYMWGHGEEALVCWEEGHVSGWGMPAPVGQGKQGSIRTVGYSPRCSLRTDESGLPQWGPCISSDLRPTLLLRCHNWFEARGRNFSSYFFLLPTFHTHK